VDYPEKLCMDLIIAGCNYRCPFCPHEDLIFHYIPMEKTDPDEFVKMIRPRLGFLDGVSISGGEPLLHRELLDFLKDLKFNGSLVKINTNASKPKMIELLLEKDLVDYFSVFVPGPIGKYKKIVNYNIDVEDVENSIQMIRKSGLDHEFRVKPVPGIVDEPELLEIANYLVGAPRFIIEYFEPKKSMDSACRHLTPYTEEQLREMKRKIAPFFNETLIKPLSV
jgi:pyruvate formate lyase activating enzyme